MYFFRIFVPIKYIFKNDEKIINLLQKKTYEKSLQVHINRILRTIHIHSSQIQKCRICTNFNAEQTLNSFECMSNINGNIQIVYFSLNFTFTRFLTTVRGTRYQRSGTSCSHHLASSVVNYVLRKLEISVQAFALLTERNVHTNVLNQTNMCMCENYRLPSPGRAATVPIANVRPFDCINRKDRSGR